MSEGESTREGGEPESPATRYFKRAVKEADAVQSAGGDLGEAVAKRRGRKPKARHDADDTPIDGWSSPLTAPLVNEDPKYAYYWASQHDLEAYGMRGWVPEQWGPKCAHPPFYFGEKKNGAPVRWKQLTLMKMPKARAEEFKRRDWRAVQHRKLMSYVLKQQAEATGGHMTVTSQTVTV